MVLAGLTSMRQIWKSFNDRVTGLVDIVVGWRLHVWRFCFVLQTWYHQRI